MKNIKNLTSGNFPEIIPDKLNYIYILLILLVVIVNYIPMILNNGIETTTHFNYLRTDIPQDNDSYWLDTINGGTPYYPLTKTIENRVAITTLQWIGQFTDWRIIFVFLCGVGVFLFLKFRRLKSLPALMGTLIYALTIAATSDQFHGDAFGFIAICFFPWVVFTLQYLKERRSVFAFALHTLSMIMIFKTLCWEIMFSTVIFLFINYFLEIKRQKVKHLFTFYFLSLTGLIFAFVSIHYPMVYILELLPKITISSSYSRLSYFGLITIISGIAYAIPSITQHILKTMESSRDDHLKLFKRIIIYTASIFMILIWGLLIFNDKIPDHRLLISITFLILYCALTLILLNEIISKRVYLIALMVIVVISLITMNHWTYLIHSTDQVEESVDQIEETSQFLKRDSEVFRIFNLSNNLNYQQLDVNVSVLRSDFPYILKRYNELIENCLLHEVENRVPFNWNVLNMLKVKYLIYNEKLPYQHLEYAFYDMESSNIIYRDIDYKPGPWFVDSLEVWESQSLVLHRINDQDFDPNTTAILETEIADNIQFSEDRGIHPTLIKKDFMLYNSHSSATGLMVISEIYFAGRFGWKAYIDDQPVPIYPINHSLSGVVVPAGEHRVMFVFEPAHFNLFANINLYTLLLVFILLIIGFILYLRENYKGEIIYVLRK